VQLSKISIAASRFVSELRRAKAGATSAWGVDKTRNLTEFSRKQSNRPKEDHKGHTWPSVVDANESMTTSDLPWRVQERREWACEAKDHPRYRLENHFTPWYP
jgi:hypothetical protein